MESLQSLSIQLESLDNSEESLSSFSETMSVMSQQSTPPEDLAENLELATVPEYECPMKIVKPEASKGRTIAFAFDIDGVCVRGKQPIPGARDALRMLQDAKIPYIFLTNGGGLTEKDHAAKLASRLGMSIDEKQFVQSHSPFHDLVPLYRDKTILCLGGHGNQIRNLAQAYGFRKVITSSDLMAEWEHIHPFPEMTREHHSAHGVRSGTLHETPIAAIMVWSSPRDWCLDLQVVTDLLLSCGGIFGKKSARIGDVTLPNNGYLQDDQPPLFFCNPDFEWATQHLQPRFAQGAFREALLGVWRYATKKEADLEHIIMGKPSETTYVYGEKVLKGYSDFIHENSEFSPAIETVYMIGDNPESDIKGANQFNTKSRIGAQWKSILVETGVYAAGTTPGEKPTHTAKNIVEAVKLALRDEGYEVVDDRVEAEDAEERAMTNILQASGFTLKIPAPLNGSHSQRT